MLQWGKFGASAGAATGFVVGWEEAALLEVGGEGEAKEAPQEALFG